MVSVRNRSRLDRAIARRYAADVLHRSTRRADELHVRLHKRLEQLDLEAQISSLPPVGWWWYRTAGPATSYRAHYVRRPFQREPDFGVTSVNYDFAELIARAKGPGEAGVH